MHLCNVNTKLLLKTFSNQYKQKVIKKWEDMKNYNKNIHALMNIRERISEVFIFKKLTLFETITFFSQLISLKTIYFCVKNSADNISLLRFTSVTEATIAAVLLNCRIYFNFLQLLSLHCVTSIYSGHCKHSWLLYTLLRQTIFISVCYFI